jgi:hypothetical protein
MKRLVLTVAATVALLGCVSPVLATPITYTETVTGSGTLDSTPFSNALVTVTLTGDTTTVLSGGGPFGPCIPCFTNAGSTTVNVFGVGTDTFTDSMVVWDNASAGINSIAIVDATIPGAVLYINNIAFSTYQLTTSIGPISSAPGLFVHVYPTTSGNFTLTSVAGTGSFTATLGPQATVPEPASIILLGTGLAAVARRRFKRLA